MNNKYKTLDQFRNSKWNTLKVALMKTVGKKKQEKSEYQLIFPIQ